VIRLRTAAERDKARQEIDTTGIALTREQETALLAACAASRSRSLLPAVTLALSLGKGHDELRLLRWKQIDFSNRALRVGHSKTETVAGRAVHLNQRATATLRAWAAQFLDRRPSP
jgi:integrase